MIILTVKIIFIANKLDSTISTIAQDYEKRLRTPLELVQLKPKQSDGEKAARDSESAMILDKIKSGETVVLLDERGKQLDTLEFAKLIESLPNKSTFVIGGSYGVNDEFRNKATHVIALSKLTLPHQLALITLVEQIYRAQCVNSGHPYHHSSSG